MRYPLYIPSKGRADNALTANMLMRDGTPFLMVVEPQEESVYREVFGDAVRVLPENDRGLPYARNWCKDDATLGGWDRHWQLDDNISTMFKFEKGKLTPAHTGETLAAVENYIDTFDNIGIAGLGSAAFVRMRRTPVRVNQECYCCVLVRTDPLRWRLDSGYEDVDYSLQVLAGGECTLLFNCFAILKPRTSTMKGGCTDKYLGDGRLGYARSLQRKWPQLVRIQKRFGMARHDVAHVWRQFPQRPRKLQTADADKGQPHA